MTVIQILACDTAELVDRVAVLLERVRSVNEEVAVRPLQQKGADREGGAEGSSAGADANRAGITASISCARSPEDELAVAEFVPAVAAVDRLLVAPSQKLVAGSCAQQVEV